MMFKIILAIAFSMFPLTIGSQNPSVYIHGGNAEDIVNKCDERTGPGLSYCFGYLLAGCGKIVLSQQFLGRFESCGSFRASEA